MFSAAIDKIITDVYRPPENLAASAASTIFMSTPSVRMSKPPRTELSKLHDEICALPFRSALPSALPDRWLRAIVRDLRDIESSLNGNNTVSPNLAGPLMLTMHVILGRMQETGRGKVASVPEDDLIKLLQLFQRYLEREIATRAIGRTGQRFDEELIAEMDLDLARFAASA